MDKSKIIENPKFIGCLNCSPTPTKTLNENKPLYEMVTLTNKGIDIFNEFDCYITLKELKEKYEDQFEDGAELFVLSALHDETYTYDAESGNWYLTNQGLGYA